MTEHPIPSPGSPDARSRGCTCSATKNKRGAGAYRDQRDRLHFIVVPDCKVHGDGSAWAKGDAK